MNRKIEKLVSLHCDGQDTLRIYQSGQVGRLLLRAIQLRVLLKIALQPMLNQIRFQTLLLPEIAIESYAPLGVKLAEYQMAPLIL